MPESRPTASFPWLTWRLLHGMPPRHGASPQGSRSRFPFHDGPPIGLFRKHTLLKEEFNVFALAIEPVANRLAHAHVGGELLAHAAPAQFQQRGPGQRRGG